MTSRDDQSARSQEAPAEGFPTPRISLGYREGLDGLRGVAVLAVMVYHGGLIRGGFLGVDVFFALSGFLITSLLLEEHGATGTVDLRSFYARRALRLLPALLVFLVFCVGSLLVNLPPQHWPLVGWYVLPVLFYVANWAGIHGMLLEIFGQTWSLAIEEQFYLIWPVVLVLLVRKVERPARMVAILTITAVASLAWRLHLALAGASVDRIYFATDAHADGLLIGAALAALLSGGRGRLGDAGKLRRMTGALSAIVLVGVLLIAPMRGYAYGVSALAVLATAGLIFDVMAQGSRIARALEAGWLAGVGRISYGLYLWHFAVFSQLGTLRRPGEAAAPLLLSITAWGVTFGAALLSYFLVERRFLTWKARFTRTRPTRDGEAGARLASVSALPAATVLNVP